MRERRGVDDTRLLCSGPGRLCQALASPGSTMDCASIAAVRAAAAYAGGRVVVGVRIGITKAADLPWRYGLAGSRFLSRPFRPSLTKARSRSRDRRRVRRLRLRGDPPLLPPSTFTSRCSLRSFASARTSDSPTTRGTTPCSDFAEISVILS